MWRGEWRLAVEQLEQHAAEGPKVDGLAVAPLEDDLRRKHRARDRPPRSDLLIGRGWLRLVEAG